jgi:hypothetical protein
MAIKTRRIQIVRTDTLPALQVQVNRVLTKNPEWTPSPAFTEWGGHGFFCTLMLTEHYDDES